MRALDVLAFLGELVLLAALAVAGARLGGVVLAVTQPVLLAVVWGWWLAPRAARPVAPPVRVPAKVALAAAAAVLLALSGSPVAGLAVLVGVGGVFALAERRPYQGR